MNGWADPLAGLNDQQKAAVIHTEGPVLILAGAGSGKTRVLSHRIAYIVQQKLARPWQILAVTFTNKAARELKDRVASITPGGDEVTAGTFHSVFLRMLRREHVALGYPRDFSIFDQDDSVRLTKMILNDFQEPDWRPKSIHSSISKLKNDMISPEEFGGTANTPREKVVASVYKEYEIRIRKHSAMDFDDLLIRPLELFRKYPAVLANWSQRWQYIHVDEYQDTNLVQFELLKTLGGTKPNLCAVGDDDQSIYGWRGARVENIFKFRDVYEGTSVYKLERNYRSTQAILDLAHAVVSGSSKREEKKLWTKQTGGKTPEITGLYTELDEARDIADRIARDVLSGKRQYKDFAILYRTNAQSRQFEDMFRSRRFPYQLIGSLSFYQRKEVKDILAYFKICLNPNDEVALRRIIKEPPRGIGDKTIDHLSEYTKKVDCSLTDALLNADKIEGLGARGVNNCRKFGDQLAQWRSRLEKDSPGDWAKMVIQECGYIEKLDNEDTFESQTRKANVEELLNSIIEETGPDPGGLAEYLEEVALATDVDKYDPDADTVRLMTIHAAKGLEFPVVFVAGLERGLFPLQNESGNVENEDEERRLFYVAVTRAREELVLTYASQRKKWGTPMYATKSQFLDEIPRDKVSWIGQYSREQEKQGFTRSLFGSTIESNRWNSINRNPERKSASSSTTIAFTSPHTGRSTNEEIAAVRVGDLVEHHTFGRGIVITVQKWKNDLKVRVEFETGNTLQLLQSKAKLQPVKDFSS